MAIGRGELFSVHLYQAMILQASMTNPEDRALAICAAFVRILGVQPPLQCGILMRGTRRIFAEFPV
ncbi:hypothetical protein BDW60DRAFT_193371 [Aspergillus nidulans var. acristatus]